MNLKPVKAKAGANKTVIVEFTVSKKELIKFDLFRQTEHLTGPEQGFRRLLTMYDEIQLLKSKLKEYER